MLPPSLSPPSPPPSPSPPLPPPPPTLGPPPPSPRPPSLQTERATVGLADLLLSALLAMVAFVVLALVVESMCGHICRQARAKSGDHYSPLVESREPREKSRESRESSSSKDTSRSNGVARDIDGSPSIRNSNAEASAQQHIEGTTKVIGANLLLAEATPEPHPGPYSRVLVEGGGWKVSCPKVVPASASSFSQKAPCSAATPPSAAASNTGSYLKIAESECDRPRQLRVYDEVREDDATDDEERPRPPPSASLVEVAAYYSPEDRRRASPPQPRLNSPQSGHWVGRNVYAGSYQANAPLGYLNVVDYTSRSTARCSTSGS